jgi:hypothetical protein
MSADIHALGAKLIAETARQDFAIFQNLVHPVVSGEPYVQCVHNRAIAYALDRVARGEVRRLIVAVPPRHFKSYLASVAFPAYLLGRDPKLHIICASYGIDLATKFAAQSRSILSSPGSNCSFQFTRRWKPTRTRPIPAGDRR